MEDNSQNRMPQFRAGSRPIWGRTINNLLILYRKSPTTFQYTWSFNLDKAWDSHRRITVFPLCFLWQWFFLANLGIFDDLYHVGCLLSCCLTWEGNHILGAKHHNYRSCLVRGYGITDQPKLYLLTSGVAKTQNTLYFAFVNKNGSGKFTDRYLSFVNEVICYVRSRVYWFIIFIQRND